MARKKDKKAQKDKKAAKDATAQAAQDAARKAGAPPTDRTPKKHA